MERSKTQRSLADQYLDQYFTPGKYSRIKTNQEKSTSKLPKHNQNQKQAEKRENHSEKNKVQTSPKQNKNSKDQQAKIQDQLDKIRSQYGEVKTMELSQQCRKILMKMQRFDRYLYPILSEKQFKQPIDLQMKRLERVKNQKKQMWKKTFDSQLLITALYNHIRLVVQMNRQLQDRQSFKTEVRQLQKKIHQMRNDFKKQLKQGKIKENQKQNIDLSKQEVITIKKIISLLQNQDSDEAQNQLKNFVSQFEKAHQDLGRLCQLFRNYIYDYKKHQSFLKQSSVQKLLVNIDLITQSLALNKIDNIKKMFHTLEKQQVRDHAQQKTLKFLGVIVERMRQRQGPPDKQTTKSQAGSKSNEKREIQRTNKSQTSKNRQYQRQINKLKGDLEKANRQQKRLEILLSSKDKQKSLNKKQVTTVSEGQNTTNRDQIIIGLQNDIQALQRDIHRLEQDNRTKTLKIHNLTKHNKQLEKKVTISQEKYPPNKSIDKSIKNQKNNEDDQIIDKIIKTIGNKQQRDILLIELKKKGLKNKFYVLLDTIIKNQKNLEIKINKLQEADELTNQHLNTFLKLLQSQSKENWWTSRNPIPNINNFKNGTHSILINRVIEKIKQIYKTWSIAQNQNNLLKKDIADFKDQMQALKTIKIQSTQIKMVIKSIEKKVNKVKQDIWQKPVLLRQMMTQQFGKKQLKQLLTVRQDYEEFIVFILQQMKKVSKEKIQLSKSIKSVTPNKNSQIQQTHLQNINEFSEKVTVKINKGESWQKDLFQLRKSMPKTSFLNFIQAIQKYQKTLQLKINKFNFSQQSLKEHLNSLINLLQSRQQWWKNKNNASLNNKANPLSQFIQKIIDYIRNIHIKLETLEKKQKQFSPPKISQNEKDLKDDINFVTQTMKNILKKASKLKNQICQDQKYLSNLLKADISAGKRSMKQLDLLLVQVHNLLLLAADSYITNHNQIMDKVDQKTLKLQQQIKDHIKEIIQLQQNLTISNNKMKKSQHIKQIQNLTFQGEIKKLKNSIQSLLNQQKAHNQQQLQENQKNNKEIERKFQQLSQQNKTLVKQNERIKNQIKKTQTDLQGYKQKQKDWKTTQKEIQKIRYQIQKTQNELEKLRQKEKDWKLVQKEYQKTKNQKEKTQNDLQRFKQKDKDSKLAQKQIQRLNNQIEKTQNDLQRFKQKQKQWKITQKQIEKMKHEIEKNQNDLQRTKQKQKDLKAAQKQIQKLRYQIQKTRNDLQKLRQREKDWKTIQKEYQIIKNQKERYQSQIQRLKQRDKDRKLTQKQIERMNNQMERTQTDLQRFKQKQKDLKIAQKQNQRLRNQLVKIQNDLQEIKLKERAWKTIQKENQKMKYQIQEALNDLQAMRQKEKELRVAQKENERMRYQIERNQNDLQLFKQRQKDWRVTQNENQRMKYQIQKAQNDLQRFIQKEKQWKIGQKENEKITRELSAVRKQLQIMKTKVSEFYKNKQSLALDKHNTQVQYQNSIAQLQMLNKITQQKLQYAQKKKTEVMKQIAKKEQQIQFEVDARNKDKTFYDKMKQKLEYQITQLSDQLQSQRRQSNKIISQLNLQKNQLKKDLDIQQSSSRQKITQLYQQIQRTATVDRDMLSLNRQIQKLKAQLFERQNNNKIQTDQLRKYIAKMNADMQTLIISKDQQKRVLRQQIQIVRQQETNRHFQKNRKLQEQNQNFKEQQSRLIYIVESNQNNFNALVQENKILYDQIQDLKKQFQMNSSERYRQDKQKIAFLENQLKMFETIIEGKSDTQQYQNALKIIDQISKQNKGLKNQLRDLQFRQKELRTLNSHKITEQNQAFMETFAKYQKILTENAQIKSNLSVLQRQVKQFQHQIEKLKRSNERQVVSKEEQIANLFKKLKNISQQKDNNDKKLNQSKWNIQQLTRKNNQLTSELNQVRAQFKRAKIMFQEQYKKIQTHIIHPTPVIPNTSNNTNQDLISKIHFLQALINQKQKQLQNLSKSQHSLRILLQQKNVRIQNLMSENYSIRLTINEKDKIIQTNQALTKVQREKIMSQNDNLLKVNTRLQQQFNKRQSSYRNDIDRLRQNCIKLQEENRTLRENCRKLQFQLQENRKQHHHQTQSMNSSNVRGYQESLQKLIIDNNDFRSQIGILQLSIKHKDEQIQEIKEKLNDLKSRLNQKLRQNQEKTRINADLNNQLKELSRQTQMKINMTQFEKKNLEETLQDLQRQKRNLHNQVDQLRRNINQKIHLETELQKLKKALYQTQNHVSNQNIKIQTLQRQNQVFIIEKQKNTSDFTNPQRQLDRMMNQISGLKLQQNNLKNLLQRRQQQLKSVKNQLIEAKFSTKQSSQKFKFQKMAAQQQLSLLQSKYDTLNSKYQRQKDQLFIKQSQLQRRLQNYQSSNDSELIHAKRQLQDEKRQSMRLRNDIEKLKVKNTQLLSLNRQIKEINQQSIKKLHKSVNENQQLQISYKANQQLVQKVNKKLHDLNQQNHKLRNGSYINYTNSQSSYQGLLIKIKQLQSRHLSEQDSIYKLQHQNRRIVNEKIMMDLQLKRLSRELQNKDDQIMSLKQNSAKNVQERKSLSQKVQNYQQHNRQQNTHLKTIVSMLDEAYLIKMDHLTQVEILLKISIEIQQLIKNNRRLQMNNKQLLQQRQRMRFGKNTNIINEDFILFGRQLIDTLFQFLFERGILTPQDVSLLRNRKQQSQFTSYQTQGQFFQQLQQILKNIFELMIDTQRRHIEVHRNVLRDIKYLMQDFFRSGNQQFLMTIKRSLQNSLE